MSQYLTIRDACALARVSRWTMIHWLARGFVRAVKIDRCTRINAESLCAFLDAQMGNTKAVHHE